MQQTQYVPNYTGYGWAGKNYDRNRTTTQDAAEIRKIVRKLWPAKEGYRISVWREYYSMGSSIHIDIKGAPFKIFRPEYSRLYKQAKETRDWTPYHAYAENFWNERRIAGLGTDHREASPEYTDDAMRLIKDLEKLGNSFRHDDSDGQIDYFDTNFYLHVGVHWETDKEL